MSGVISVIGLSVWADKKQVRWCFVMYPYLIAAAGCLALLAIPHPELVFPYSALTHQGWTPGLLSLHADQPTTDTPA